MHEKVKNYLGVAIIVSLLIVSFAAVGYVSTYSKSIKPSSFRSFFVSGEGKVVVVPDIAQFTFSVITEGGVDLAKLQVDNTKKVNAAINFVKSNGVEDKDIKTQNYNINPRYQYFTCQRNIPILSPGEIYSGSEPSACPPPEIVGYTISQTVLVKARDFEKAGMILSGVVESGANSVSQLSFTIDDLDEYQNKAREEAIKEAKEKAKMVAKAAGFGLGRLLSITEGWDVPFKNEIYRATTMGMGGEFDTAVSAPAVEPGSEEVVVSVTLTYEID
ncbi:MAG: hypothetical protein COU46_03225 [Candidatus Niyogibacteria bacterium CG10_big_fil_rev_8_21_14_0_10_42_19]|uniref:SIMPL domain-containing protein n=1 Tax=Candidatus Niyogibacteria bacterium CG10_big_fil_rev_8_21_14_0_10_42_19 TaxID=1974725 RepID=A0A2H0TF05_9BACT|nr:MAG: hypothetical protein COU46_03225 [Candidatus Niyogibacteria bacterium CG10_big_fil_rev_8_21_14_0_10_42_19]